MVCVAVAYGGVRLAIKRLRSGGVAAIAAVGVVAVGVVATVVWELLAEPGPSLAGNSIRTDLHYLHRDFGDFVTHLVGGFGVQGVAGIVIWSWLAAVVCLVLVAGFLGTWRHRAALLATIALGMATTVGVAVFVIYPIGPGGFQGRYVLPFLVVIPLLAAEIASRNLGRFSQAFTQGMRGKRVVAFGAVSIVSSFILAVAVANVLQLGAISLSSWAIAVLTVFALFVCVTFVRRRPRSEVTVISGFLIGIATICAAGEFSALHTDWEEYSNAPSYFIFDYHHAPAFWVVLCAGACALLVLAMWKTLSPNLQPADMPSVAP
jgi:hypothetical protein